MKQGKDPSSSADPWKVLEENVTAQQRAQARAAVDKQAWSWVDDSKKTSSSSADPWKSLEQSVSEKKRPKVNAAADNQTWSWVDDYAKETRERREERLAREAGQAQERWTPAKKETDAGTFEPRRRSKRDDRYRRDDLDGRDGRDSRVRRTEKSRDNRQRRGVYDIEREDYEDDDFYEGRRRRKAEKAEKERQKRGTLQEAGPTPIFLPEYISVSNLAIALGQKTDVFVSQLEQLGFEEVSKDHILTGETAALVAQEYGFEPTVDTGEEDDLKPRPPPEDPSSLPLRPPVVTIMGHVDHGKTTLLDYLRQSSIVAQEHGGITQHIGAFSVKMSSGKQITFLDTPGHAAFLSMRQRGATVTDMIILVVAADDSVMPQTLEAIKHARTAKVPIIVAINKIDKPEANVNRVKSDLASHGVEIEDYGGDVQVVCVSGKTGQGMDDLEENILTLSEMLDIRAELDGMAEGWVLESTIKPIGRVATVLVKRGTLRPGDFIVAGRVHAKIRSLRNEAGVEIAEALPGTAVEILGWKEPPEAGDMVLQAPDEDRAKGAVRYRAELKDRGEVIAQMAQQEQNRREKDREREEAAAAEAAAARKRGGHPEAPATTPPTEETGTKYVNFTVKGDVHGSIEAVSASILEQGNNEVRGRVLLAAPGQINESDIEHAAVSGSTIINFNNPAPARIKAMADEAGVKIMEHNVIYHLIEDVKEQLIAALPPLIIKKVVGEAEVLQIFPINIKRKVYKNIAGCRINNGTVIKGGKARVLRNGEVIFEGVIETLKNVKKDVDEMKKGSECGLSFAGWDELQQGDHIQAIEEITEKRQL
ncbi:Translation initiation factor IF-2, mitochondrial [Madurella mycetomatis]|uniref:Translation initiation factor IF-2, mitochondrial n=1 Tax=Madurella mycetomatis TaxID=100816 RepID=A0A175WFW5_9PEZI|nr:Translation initiation factor IF-2, mitochondrial [Madurella mycetomatis]